MEEHEGILAKWGKKSSNYSLLGVLAGLSLMALVVCLGPQPIWGQKTSASIAGSVVDTSGAVIPGASIVLTNTDTNVEVLKRTTDDAGRYVIPAVQPGNYEMTVSQSGFKTEVRRGIVIHVNEDATLDLTLQIGAVSQTVEVTGAVPLLTTQSASLSNVVERKPVQELPLNGRFFVNLVTLTTGVAPAAEVQNPNGTRFLGARAGNPGVETNGQRPGSNNYTVNGIDNEESTVANIVLYPPVDVIQEFRIQTSNQDAEFGKNPGATINVVTRGGTNTFHGGAYEFLRNDALDAANFFDKPGAKPPFRLNEYGANVGGPIQKNKTFFLGYWEGERIRQGQTYVQSVPTPQMRLGDFSQFPNPIYDPTTLNTTTNTKQQFPGNIIPTNRLDQVAENLTTLNYPLPNLPGVFNNFAYFPTRKSNGVKFGVRVDRQLTSKDTFYTQFMYENYTLDDPQLYPLPIGPAPQFGVNTKITAATETLNARGLMINENHIFSPTLVSDLHLGFTREWVFFPNALQGVNAASAVGIPGINNSAVAYSGGLPGISVGGYTGIGESGIQPFIVADNNYEVVENMSWIKGKHNLRFGGNGIRRQYNFFQANGQRGNFNFNGTFTSQLGVASTGSGYADFLLGIPFTSSLSVINNEVGQRQWENGFYLQDTWSATSRLTLTLGLRYEMLLPRKEIYNRQGNFDPRIPGGAVAVASSHAPCGRALRCVDWHDLGPRFAFAYKVNNKTAVRGGFGVFYDDYAVNGFGGITTGLMISPPFWRGQSIVNSITTPTNTIDAGVPSVVNVPVVNGYVFPVSGINYTTVYQDPHGKNAYVEEYNFTVERELGNNSVASISYVGNQAHRDQYTTDINQAVPGPGPIAPRRPFPNWPGITSMVMNGQGSYNSLQVAFKQRAWKGLNYTASYTWSHSIDDATGEFGGISSIQNYYDLQGSRGNSLWNQPQLFTFAGSYELPFGPGKPFGSGLTGVAARVAGGWQINAIYTAASGLPFTPGVTDVSNTGRGSRPDRICSGVVANPNIRRWFNPGCFVSPQLYHFGNAGKAILTGPGTNELDFSLFKNTYISADNSRYLEFRAEFFNISNTPQFNNPNASIGSPAAGIISSAGNPPNFSRTSRQIQFALKFYF